MGEGIKACARPTGSPVSESEQRKTKEEITTEKEGVKMIRVGQKPPDFTALAYHKGKIINVKLSGHLNKWVLLCFYPGDFTYVLATEISAVAQKHSEFKKLGVQVLSMSIDSVFVNKMWNDHEPSKMVNGDVPFPMLSDTGGKVGSAFGVYDDQAGVEARGRFIIDPDGVIQGYEILTPPVERNVSESIRGCRRLSLYERVEELKQFLQDGSRVK